MNAAERAEQNELPVVEVISKAAMEKLIRGYSSGENQLERLVRDGLGIVVHYSRRSWTVSSENGRSLEMVARVGPVVIASVHAYIAAPTSSWGGRQGWRLFGCGKDNEVDYGHYAFNDDGTVDANLERAKEDGLLRATQFLVAQVESRIAEVRARLKEEARRAKLLVLKAASSERDVLQGRVKEAEAALESAKAALAAFDASLEADLQ